MKVEITALAEADLEAIYQRIWEDSSARAAAWRRGLLHAAQAAVLNGTGFVGGLIP